jgi:anti-sigma B factor antagonist
VETENARYPKGFRAFLCVLMIPTASLLGSNPSFIRIKPMTNHRFRNNYLQPFHSPISAQGRLIGQVKIMSQTSTCALWEEQRLNGQDKEPKLRLSVETRVTEDVTVICCKGRIAYGIEAAALSGEIAELGPQTRRVVIDLSGVEIIDAAGLGALISVALTAQARQCSIKLAAPSNLIRQLLELTKLTSVFEVHPTLDAATVASPGQAA